MVAANTAEKTIGTIEILKEITIAAPIEVAFEALLAEIGPDSMMMGDKPMPMVFEPWPGGRWYRDLGNNAGHFWGHVQVIKPPTLLEICGPMFMSVPAMNHLQYRLTAGDQETLLKLTHRGIGDIPREFREGVHAGWQYKLDRIRTLAARLKGSR